MDDDVSSPRPVTTTPSRHRADVSDLSDPELVSRISKGSHAALAEVYDRHGGPTHGLAARLCGTDADDIVQDVFLRLWQHPDRFDAKRGSVRSFLMLQTRSRSIDILRSSGSRRARETATWVEHTGPAAEDGALARLAADRSWWLLSRLDEGQRSAIALAYFGDQTYREVAALLEVPEGTAKSRIRQGLTHLRRSIELDKVDQGGPHGTGPSRSR